MHTPVYSYNLDMQPTRSGQFVHLYVQTSQNHDFLPSFQFWGWLFSVCVIDPNEQHMDQ